MREQFRNEGIPMPPNNEQSPEAREIPLTMGYVALVSPEDYGRVSAYKWAAAIKKKRKTKVVYARRSVTVAPGKEVTVLMHRFILGCTEEVDHADTNGLNNQRYNLRPANKSLNQANVRKQPGGTSRFKGVSWKKQSQKWVAQIKSGQVKEHLGYFRDEVDAAQAYNFRAYEIFGEFARLRAYEIFGEFARLNTPETRDDIHAR